jgi:hypothetical protein
MPVQDHSTSPLPDSKERKKANARAYYHRHRDECSRRHKAYYRANKDRWRFGNLRREYGLSESEYNRLMSAQEGRCPICKSLFGPLKGMSPCVDHCHETGRIRALLCVRCNTVIGHAGDDPGILQAAIRYLENQRS